MNKVSIENKSGVTIHGLKPGGQLPIKVDENGTPLDKHWRRRLKDAKIDKSVQLVGFKKKSKRKEA